MKNIKTIFESNTGKNLIFRNPSNGQFMSHSQFVTKISLIGVPGYHNRNINGILTPVSNPDKSRKNNLG